MFGMKNLGKVVLALASVTLFTGNAFADNLTVDGKNRSMLVYAPSGIEKNRPLIIQMHGMNQDAPYQKNAAKWESIADTARFVVVFPNGENKAWDIGGDKDVNFLKAIINEMYQKYGIDKNRVYVSGFSMGGMMSYHAANKMGDMIAAIAPVSGGGGVNSPKRAMPIMHTHGTTDDVVNYNSTVNTLKGWVNAQKCSSNSQKIKPYPSTKPGSAASLEIWSGCTDGVMNPRGNVMGTYLHGLFDDGQLFAAIASQIRTLRGESAKPIAPLSFEEFREKEFDRIAAIVRSSVDMDAIYRIIRGEAVPCVSELPH